MVELFYFDCKKIVYGGYDMSEEICCMLGKVPKVLSYVNDGKYVHSICKLKDQVDCFKLRDFFNMVYSMKLDIWDADIFMNGDSTGDLINCFYLILEEKNFINLKNLCLFIVNSENRGNHSILYLVKQFFSMFEVVEENFVYLNDFDDVKLVAMNSDDMFYKEVESIFYNSIVIEYMTEKRKNRVRKQSS